ncbi:MAG: class I SAM-dependent rRNA methyltransferase [Spirochaetaceae bacterium]|nr:class I SAM-dependent rRNA methyltransferase [Spirochaetaceae bacterium]
MKRIILKQGEEGRIVLGHPWVYDNEIDRVLAGNKTAELEPGELADVESSRARYLGRAFVNPASKIRARIYSPSKEGLDKGFFKRRLREALLRRAQAPAGGPAWAAESRRILFGEADFLPGLVADRYAGWPLEDAEALPLRPLSFAAVLEALGPPSSWLVLQFLALGLDRRREEILAALEEVLAAPLGPEPWAGPLGKPAGILERSAPAMRELEGLPPGEGLLAGEVPAGGVLIFENGLPFALRLGEGQKTGHFLDQRENRLRAAAYARGAVLDAFCYTGGFALHAAAAGEPGLRVTAVDSSGAALELLRRNAALGGVAERITPLEADVFEYLRAAEKRREHFDLIILDPPAFAKTRSALSGAIRGYREINMAALRLLRPGGVLVTCSCSQAVDPALFMRIVAQAAAGADRRLVQEDFRFQAADHPLRVGYGESLYLKCGFYRVV